MANIVLGIVVVSLFLLIAPFILLNFLWVGGEYSYGFMMGMSFISSIFMLLVGSSLESADNVSSNLSPGQGWAGYTWGSTESNTFTSTYAFAYILCGSFIVMTFLLWLCRDVFAPHVIKKPVEIPVIVPTAAEVAAVGAPPGAIPVPVQGGTTVVFNPVAAPTPVSEVAPAVEAPPSATPARTGSPTLPPPPAENPFTTPGPSNV